MDVGIPDGFSWQGGGPLSGGSAMGGAGSGGAMRVLRVSSLGGLDPETAEIAEEQLLGTDFMFFVAFAGECVCTQTLV